MWKLLQEDNRQKTVEKQGWKKGSKPELKTEKLSCFIKSEYFKEASDCKTDFSNKYAHGNCHIMVIEKVKKCH